MKIMNTKRTSVEDIMQAFVSVLNEKKICYAILGNTEKLPDIEADLDICTDRPCHFMATVRDFCIAENIYFFNVTHHATGIRCDLAALTKSGKLLLFPGPDIMLVPTCHIDDAVDLTFPTLLRSRIFDSRGFFVPSNHDAFIHYFAKKVAKGQLTQDHGKYLSRLFHADPTHIQQTLWDTLSAGMAQIVVEAAKSQSWKQFEIFLPEMRRELKPHSTWNTGRVTWIVKRIFHRLRHPTGLVIAFLGADGSGKSTVIDHTISTLGPAFQRTSTIHLRPAFGWAKRHGEAVVNPHAKPPRHWIISVVKIFYFLFDYAVGWWAIVRPRLVRTTFVLFDRYYHDLLVDPLRYRYGGPMWLARWVGKFIPQPALWILLDAPAETLQARKQEIPLEETDRQRKEYLKLVKRMKNSVVVDASQSLDDVVSDVNAAILRFMAERTSKRLGQ